MWIGLYIIIVFSSCKIGFSKREYLCHGLGKQIRLVEILQPREQAYPPLTCEYLFGHFSYAL